MNVPLVSSGSYQPSFGILKGHNKTPYGEYMWGIFKGKKIEVFDVYKDKQKLWFVSEFPTLNFVKYKLSYLKDGVKKVEKSEISRSYKTPT